MKRYLLFLLVSIICFSCSEKEKATLPGGPSKDDFYFEITVDGVKKELQTIHYARQGKTIHLATFGLSGLPNLNVTMTARNEDDFRGVYPYHYNMQAGTCIALYGIAAGDGYESHWWDCPPSGQGILMPSPGSVNIENIERNNGQEIIMGTINVQVYQPQGDCPYAVIKKKSITGKFRLKKA